MYSSEYTSGFSGPVASHLVAPLLPRHEGNVGQAPIDKKADSMPTISMFYGILIRMFFRDIEKHHVPHIHAD